MSNPFFHFKQFTVRHDKCAMKVGTDGVLLGAWADVGLSNPLIKQVLDVGAGTGLIALMIAQRNIQAVIDAIDIDKESCEQAIENVEKSPFKERIQVIRQSFFDFSTEKKYDLIISNPPFFNNALKSPDKKRNTARHNGTLPLKQLINHAIPMLSINGRIALILPIAFSEELDFIIATNRLYIKRRTLVISIEGSQPKRFLIEITTTPPPYQKQMCENLTDTLILETKDHLRTPQYKALTNDFYF